MSNFGDLKFYAVKNKEGKFLRSKGYGGYGPSWVDDITKAKIYPKPGPARGQITWWASAYPEYGIPALIELYIGAVIEINEEERVNKAIKTKKRAEFNLELYWAKEKYKKAETSFKNRMDDAKYLEQLAKNIENIENELKKLND